MPRPEPLKSPVRGGVQTAPAEADRKKEGGKAASAGSETLEWIKSLGIAVVLFLLIRTFLVQAFSIPSGSMEGTLLIGDYLMANNAVFGAHVPFTDARLPAFRDPRHGEIVVFRPTYNDPVIDVVKRVIGEPGDTIQMVDHVVYRNGQALDEPYVFLSGAPDRPMELTGLEGYEWHLRHLAPGVDPGTYRPTRDNWGPLVVPQGHYMLLGDNRDHSWDSRFTGFIPRDVIRGKPMFIYFSYDPNAGAPFPAPITAARWGRIGTGIR